MVIGRGFAWAHLPKTGGDATLAMFRLFPDLIEFADPDDTNDKHAQFHERADQVRGRLLVMNFRRLPAWALSRAQHRNTRGAWPDYRPEPMASAEELAESSFPDGRIELYTDHGRFTPDRWLRQEMLAADFLDFVSGIREVSERERQGVLELGAVNAASYDHEIANWFSADQIRRMYLSNPWWARIERELYGSLYELPAQATAPRAM